MKKLFGCVALFIWGQSCLYAQERVYTTVDAQGRMQIIKSQDVSAKQQTTVEQSQTVEEKKQATPKLIQHKQVNQYELDGEKYIDSDQLEHDISTKKPESRFYYVPTGALGEKVVESVDNVPVVQVTKSPKVLKSPIKQSSTYQVLTKEWLLSRQNGLQAFCQKVKGLKSVRAFKESNPLWIEAVDFLKDQPDKTLMLDEPLSVQTIVRFASFATSHKKPKFYLPMVVFLDEQGCVLEGAWHYWSQAKPANENQYSALEGLLNIPMQTKYIVFYPPDKELDVTLSLQNYGSLLLEKYETTE